MKKVLKKLWQTACILWEDVMIGLKMLFYVLVILLFLLGVIALFSGGSELGVVLIIVNFLLFLLLRKLDHVADRKFEEEFKEFTRRNREESGVQEQQCKERKDHEG
ncbi:MAG: hypothetical protein SOT60_07245 [Bilifractor sp.]|nr:hypothetical protein [Bilifractor sp.]